MYKKNHRKNKKNVKNTLEIIETFFVWSGLKVNRGKTYLSFLTQNLEKMEQNYKNGIKSIRKELTSRKFYISDSF